MSTSAGILGSPPIHLVASVGNIDGAKLLLQSDPSLAYLQDADGLFPVHVAARMGHVNMVILFMQAYLDSGELLDHCGRNFLHIAAEANKSTVFTKLFTKSDDDTMPALMLGMLTGMFNATDNPLVGMLTGKINITDDPLLVGMLTAMINTTDNQGNTPLHLAAEKGCKLVMKALMVNEKVDVDLRNRSGLTPFDISVIQVNKSSENSPGMQDRIEQYIQKKGSRITSHWLNNFMHITRRSFGNVKDADNFMGQLQIIGLGAVLITTVTFAAAFTLPGGSMDSGLPRGEKFGFGIWTRSIFGDCSNQ
ncbi:hypothetical protein LUZ60_010706 [Juncus effusus]|nr:hypothetical protein LUZ60_010706 [Juncus effusus]